MPTECACPLQRIVAVSAAASGASNVANANAAAALAEAEIRALPAVPKAARRVVFARVTRNRRTLQV
jgi:hypothetical protein